MPVTICNWAWRVLIAVIFLLAALTKYQQGINFLPPWSVYDRFVAFSPLRHYGVIVAEVLIAIWLISGVKTRWAASAAGLVLSGFIVILAIELTSDNPAHCGCGIMPVYPGEDPRIGLRNGIVRNGLILLGCLWLLLLGDNPKPATQAKEQPVEQARV